MIDLLLRCFFWTTAMASDDSYQILEQAAALIDDQESAQALALLNKIIENDSEFAEAFDHRGLVFLQLGLCEDALRDFDRALGYDLTDDAVIHAHRAEALRNLHRYDEALTAAVSALDDDPDSPDARYLRGWLFFMCGQYQEAIDDLDYYVEHCDEVGEAGDMLALSKKIVEEKLSPGKIAFELRHNGFSANPQRNDDFAADEMFCPYAHCIRIQPLRGREALDCCPVTGFACPGGEKQTNSCEGRFD